MKDLTGGKGSIPVEDTGPPLYIRKQAGHGMTIVVLAGLACIIYLISERGVQKILVVYMVLAAALALMFSSMTIMVGGGFLTVRFGLSFLRKKIKLSDIESCRAVKNPWYYGWGIRRIPGGWYFGVSGQAALELTMRSGKRLRIGSPDPEELKTAISEFSST